MALPPVEIILCRQRAAAVKIKSKKLASRKDANMRTPGHGNFHRKLGLKNLFQQFALIDICGRTDSEAFAALEEHDLVRIFARKIEFMSDDHDGARVARRETPQSFQQIDLCANVQMQS